MTTVPFLLVDAFAHRTFSGNPAGVCVLASPARDAWMQAVAAEVNQAETAFLVPRVDGFDLRWFTPTVEVDLCGHATLASAHVLWTTGRSADPVLRFHTKSGVLTAKRHELGIELDFPALTNVERPAPAGLIAALGIDDAVWVGANAFDYLVEVSHASGVRAAGPNFQALRAVTADMRGVVVTATSDDPRYDIVSRFFAPAAGIDEDPVTGSAHCALSSYWAPRLGTTLRAFQASRRTGVVVTELVADRVRLRGQAVTVVEGRIRIDAD